MKTLILYKYCILVVTAFLVVSCSLSSQEPSSTEHIWLVDITDPLRVYPDTGYIHAQINTDDNSLWEEKTISLSTISDYYHNPVYTFHIPNEQEILSNPYIRRTQLYTTFIAIDSVLRSMKGTTTPHKARSRVYTALCTHLNSLAKSKAKNKSLYLYSNLMENNPSGISFYHPATFNQLTKHPEAILQELQKEGTLPDLSDIAVYLVYSPHSLEDHDRYHTVATFYIQLLEKHQAKVYQVSLEK